MNCRSSPAFASPLRNLKIHFWTVALFLVFDTPATGTISAQVLRVSTVAQLQASIDAAHPGDRILVEPGVYRSRQKIRVKVSGTSSEPIVIAAAQLDEVVMKDNACFDFVKGASYIEIRGFTFFHGCHFEIGGTEGEPLRHAGQLIPSDSRGVRFIANTFQISGGSKDCDVEGAPEVPTMHWLVVRGDDAVIEHNRFQKKNTKGVFLAVGEKRMPQRTRVRRNHFLDQCYTCGNKGESLRIGAHDLTYPSHTVVEGNLFERANGDPEAISSKSGDVIIRFNTIRESEACGIVLRSADRNLVYGNFITDSRCGIRVHGDDHRIFNNVIVHNRGPAFYIDNGDVADLPDPPNAGNAYDAPRDVLIAFNTIVWNKQHIEGRNHRDRDIPPSSVRIANNIIVGDSGVLVNLPWKEGFGFDNNILWGNAAPGDNIPTSGYSRVDPGLEEDANGIYRLTTRSPAIDAATTRHPEIRFDYDGQRRTDPKDVGADERTSGRIKNRPLTKSDVGPRQPLVIGANGSIR